MKQIRVSGQTGTSVIMVGQRLDRLADFLPDRHTVIITDENVNRFYGDRFPKVDKVVIGCGEKIKTLDTVADIYRQLIDLQADRSSFIVGIGGGIVGDVTGFAASTYMRGLPFGFVATTLLAQVDATVGGKNGVNLDGYKNMVGVFNQPEFVMADIGLLESLPAAELASGLAEIVKHGAIGDIAYLERIEADCEAILALDHDTVRDLVFDSVAIKASVVNQDEKEAGQRRILNFGHTIGHALEKHLGISHGHAVSAGMVMAADLSVDQGLLDVDQSRRLAALLERLGLPTRLSFDPTAVFEALGKDKKRAGDVIGFVMLEALGRAVIKGIGLSELGRWLKEP